MWEQIVFGVNNFGAQRLVQCTIDHVKISLGTLAVCMLIGIPLGILCARSKWLSSLLIGFSNFMKVIPSLALMIILLPYLGAGMKTAGVALVILGLPPILVNTCLGIRNIDPSLIEAARGIGMDNRTVLWKVQVPLALPMMLVGVRTTGVMLVACATFAFYVGGGGLGSAIAYGNSMHLIPLLVISSALVAIMTALLDLLFSVLQKKVDAKYTL